MLKAEIPLYTAWKKAISKGKSWEKRMKSSRIPIDSMMKVAISTDFRMTKKSLLGVCRSVFWTISRT